MENMKDRVTIYQVAKAAGVSLATVSRVINHSGNVTEETRRRVEKTIADLGYKPSGVAQALATNRSTNIGIVVPSANYVFIANLLNGVTEIAREKKFTLTLFSTYHSREDALEVIEKVITSHVDGAVIFDDQLQQADIDAIGSYNVPTVLIDSKATGEKVANIRLSFSDILKSKIRHYYENGGDKPMSFLHVHNAGRLRAKCEKAFIQVHEELGREYHIINCPDSYSRTYSEFQDYFNDPEHRKGFFICHRDSISAAVINAARENGLSIPEDVEIVSLVGTKYAYILRPTLSAFHIDFQEVGKRAMYMLIDLMNRELVEKNTFFDAKFMAGETTIHW